MNMALEKLTFKRYERQYFKSKFKTSHIKLRKLNIVFLLMTINLSVCSEIKSNVNNDNPNIDVNKFNIEEGRSIDDIYINGTFHTGNNLWDNILNHCTVDPSVSCLQKNFYTYLDENLAYNGDLNVNGVCFKKNKVDLKKYTKEANIIYLTGTPEDDTKKTYNDDGRTNEKENEIDDEDEESETPLEEVTDALYDKGIEFLMTHDMKLRLPEIYFHGATLKVSPRALTKSGALVHIDLEPKEEPNGQGRIFFKKIKKYIRKKLIMAAIGIILVVKLIALKLVFVLPVIVGVTTAKKMFLKFVLFIFPALSHIFKLCSWYHQNYHTTKFHHHHHTITHHHHKQPHQGHGPYSHSSPQHSSVAISHPPEPPSFEHYPQDWELSGPGLGNEYVAAGIHRNAISKFKPHIDDVNDINAWGLGMPPGQSSLNVGEYGSPTNTIPNVAPTLATQSYRAPHGINNGRPIGPPGSTILHRPMKPKDKLQAEKEALLRAAALAARAPPSPVRDEVLRASAVKLAETNRVQLETQLVKQQQEILAAQDPDTQAAEKFYGPLLEKVDRILVPMGASEPSCRARAICFLYKDPIQHTPYSNLVSNELSKDSSELVPAAESKLALRYYSYVQAARDGQEQKDCISLYPDCRFNFK